MKNLLAAIAFLGISVVATAQEDSTPTDKFSVATNSFASNWFVTVQGSYSNYIDGSADNSLLSTPMWGGSIALGKWFTPGLGLRLKMNGRETKNMNFVNTGDNHNTYWILTADVMFNLTNLFYGYNEKRVWNLTPYIAGGLGHNCTVGHSVPIVGTGLLSTWKVSTKIDLNLECSYKSAANDFGGITGNTSDRIFAIEAGITYRIGKNTWKKSIDTSTADNITQMEIDALNAQIADLEAENERLRNENKNEAGE